MPKLGGMEMLERIVEAAPETDVVLLTGNYSTDSAMEAIRKGASDYLTKPIPVALTAPAHEPVRRGGARSARRPCCWKANCSRPISSKGWWAKAR